MAAQNGGHPKPHKQAFLKVSRFPGCQTFYLKCGIKIRKKFRRRSINSRDSCAK